MVGYKSGPTAYNVNMVQYSPRKEDEIFRARLFNKMYVKNYNNIERYIDENEVHFKNRVIRITRREFERFMKI